jgi:hypothetical protein
MFSNRSHLLRLNRPLPLTFHLPDLVFSNDRQSQRVQKYYQRKTMKLKMLDFNLMRAALLPAAAALIIATPRVHAAFTAGDLAVFSADVAGTTNTSFTILELSPATPNQSSPVNSISINGTTGPNALRTSGSASSTGYLADSDDGTLVVFTGHNSTTATGNANTILARGVGTLDNAGNFALQTTYTGVSGQQTRCATSVNKAVWFVGDQNGIYTNGISSPLNTANARGVKSFGGTIYVMRTSATAIVVASLSADGKTLTALPGLPADNSAQDFYLVSSGANGAIFDVLYVLDETGATAGTVQKYSLVSGTWAANGTYATSFGGFGLCAATNGGGGAALYVTTGTGATAANKVIKLADTAGFNSTISINTPDNLTLYTAATGTTMKGIAFAPKNAPPVTMTGIAVNSDGSVKLNGACAPGTNVVWRTDSLTPPVAWTPIYTNIVDPTGIWQWTDPTPTTPAFYRSQAQQ